MLDEARLLELANAELDGTLSAAERAELSRLLLQHPEARRLHESLGRTHALLGQVPQAEPPAGLRAAIRQALALPAEAGRSNPGRPAGRLPYRYAAAIAGGLAVAGLGFALLQDRPAVEGLQGSVGQALRSTAPASEAAWAAPGMTGHARLGRSAGGLTLEIELRGQDPQSVVVRFDPAQLQLRAFADGAIEDPAVGAGRVVLPASQGALRRTLEFTAAGEAPATVEVEVLGAGGEPLDRAELGLPAG